METELLAQGVERKYECLEQLRDLGRRQMALVDQGEMATLLDVLAAKQRLLVRLQQIEKALDPFRDQDARQRQWVSESQRLACAEKLNGCQELLREIVAQEKQSEQRLIRRRDEAAIQLQGVHAARQACGAYGDKLDHNNAGQIDLLSDT
ncbi:MAG: hypothetical protein HQ581_07245 [Planctomycetes bacterium]|nr:hypothetical protein [Planctomycetota bacterium]